MLIRIAAALALLVASCREPRAGLRVFRDGTQYAVMIEDCHDTGQQMPVWSMTVERRIAGGWEAPICEMRLRPRRAGKVLSRLTFGEPVDDYDTTACPVFKRNERYRVNVNVRPNPAVGHFDIDTTGEVVMVDGECRE